MKTTYMMAFVAMASVLAIGAITVNGSMFPLVTASVSSESSIITGHVEYTLYNSAGDIKAYRQLDNIVVNRGDDCTAQALFKDASGSGCDSFSGDGFTFIAIGNATSITVANSDTTLKGTLEEVHTDSGGGLMALREDTNAETTPSTNNGASTIIATQNPFTFKDNTGTHTNATTILNAGLFDRTCSGEETTFGTCNSDDGTMNMFSVQEISVAVGEGDSLDVTWTITTGG